MNTEMFDQNLIRHVSERSNLALRLEGEKTNRRGAKMLKLSDGETYFGLKVATDSSAPVALEAALLKELGSFTQLYVAEGSYEGHAWLLQNWLGGQSVYGRVKQLRKSDDAKPELLKLFTAMFTKVAELHTLGYLHGDLQPDHFRLDGGAVYLLDFALTRRVDELSDYGGAMVHFSAPEVCRQQVSGQAPVIYDALAELYSLASVVFFLYTGQVSPDYGVEDMRTLSLGAKRERIARGRKNSFSSASCEPFSSLERTLETCLEMDRGKRYQSVTEAARALQTSLTDDT